MTLDGSGSGDPNGDFITYAWTLSVPVGSNAVLSNATSAMPTFTADKAGSYVATLVVSDGTLASAAAMVTTTAAVANVAPVANAGSAQNISRGSLVTLDGSSSSDANGDVLTYLWSFTARPAGSATVLSALNVVNPSLTPDIAGVYVVQLIVNDGQLSSVATTVTITAAPIAVSTDLIVNGSFEQGLTAWAQGTQVESGGGGACGYNAAVAPGSETLTGTTGFPATSGVQIALGSVSSTTGIGLHNNCVLYQDVPIPAGTTGLTLSYDIAATAGDDGCQQVGARVGLYAITSIPALLATALGGSGAFYCTATPGTVLSTVTQALNPSSITGSTVRVAFINSATSSTTQMGHEVIGIDSVHLIAVATN